MSKKILKGVVTSTKLPGAIKVQVVTYKKHPKYAKKFIWHKNYLADNRNADIKDGDSVIIEECKPVSKLKKWIVKEKI